MFENPAFDDHEHVTFVCRPEVGLRAIVAIHDTTMGPALGGIRMWPYADGDEALADALRLARGMTFKNALAGLPFGGGKSVILGDPRTAKSPALLAAFADTVEQLGGRYVGAEDVGIGVDDVRRMRKRTKHVSGVGAGGAAGGDPSPWTALGVLAGIRAAVEHKLGRTDLAGLTVAIQGLGAVGFALARHLHRAGCRLVVADLDRERTAAASAVFRAEVSGPEAILAHPCDVLAPCALGAVLDRTTIPRIRARIVAGSANNQLATPTDAAALEGRGILYVPDYVLNAGGVIAVALEHRGELVEAELRERVEAIGDTVREVLARADRQGLTPAAAADRAALSVLARARLGARAA